MQALVCVTQLSLQRMTGTTTPLLVYLEAPLGLGEQWVQAAQLAAQHIALPRYS
jgi:hypothetical protein